MGARVSGTMWNGVLDTRWRRIARPRLAVKIRVVGGWRHVDRLVVTWRRGRRCWRRSLVANALRRHLHGCWRAGERSGLMRTDDAVAWQALASCWIEKLWNEDRNTYIEKLPAWGDRTCYLNHFWFWIMGTYLQHMLPNPVTPVRTSYQDSLDHLRKTITVTCPVSYIRILTDAVHVARWRRRP